MLEIVTRVGMEKLLFLPRIQVTGTPSMKVERFDYLLAGI